MNLKAKVASNFSSLTETEGLLKVTGSHVRCKSGNISETVKTETLLQQTTNRKRYVTHTELRQCR